MRSSGKKCVQFYYHMFGSTMGTLSVYVVDQVGYRPSAPAWMMSGDQGDVWNLQTINIDKSTDFRVSVGKQTTPILFRVITC